MFEQTFKNIDDILHKDAGCTSELDYTEQSSWLLFLKYLDALEQDKANEAALEGKKYTFILAPEYRWEAWAAPNAYFADSDQSFRAKSISRFAPCRSPGSVDVDQGVTCGHGRKVKQQMSRRDRAWSGGGASRRSA